jgi:hypothetical protein
MTALPLASPAAFHPLGLARLRQDAPLLTALGLALALSLLPTLAAMQLDDRLFQGESLWLKPVKFQIALALYVLTLAVFARWLPQTLRESRLFRLYIGVVAACTVGEMLWIGGAAALGTASHFNETSGLWIALYALMGVFAVTLTSAALVMGIAIWRNAATGLPAPVHLAVSLGLILTFALTVPVAGYMSGSGGHFVETPAPWDARTLERLRPEQGNPDDFATLLLPRSELEMGMGLPVGPDGQPVEKLRLGEGVCLWGPVIHAGAFRGVSRPRGPYCGRLCGIPAAARPPPPVPAAA